MELVADILLVAGTFGAGFFCFILARRLTRFNDLEKGVGGAVALLSGQVDDLAKTLIAARTTSDRSNDSLDDLTSRAEVVAQRLELMMASMHDIPEVDQHPSTVKSRPAAPPSTGPMFIRHGQKEAEVRP